MNDFHNPGHETLARRALDRTRLLEGENPDSLQVDDAVHWSAVYAEMIGFKQILLAQMRKSLQQLPVEAAAEIRTVDMAIIRKQLERYEACRAFWEQRQENLVREESDGHGRVKVAAAVSPPIKQ
jgi:hypothetical protein